MEIHFKKGFVKAYQKLSQKEQIQVDLALETFQKDPFDPVLKNHALKGNLAGKRAISAAFDLRIIYTETDDHTVVTLLKAGSHNQVY